MLDQAFTFLFPIILIAIAMIFDDTLFAFFGGTASIFAGLTFLFDTYWIGMIFLGLGIYFVIAAIWIEFKGE